MLGLVAIALFRRYIPAARTRAAGMGCSRNIQTWAPLPEREISVSVSMPALLQAFTYAVASDFQLPSSKSHARSWH